MKYYKNLREYLAVLEQNGKLVRIRRALNKDSEMHPLRTDVPPLGIPKESIPEPGVAYFDEMDEANLKGALPVC